MELLQPAISPALLILLIAEMLVVNQHLIAVAQRALGGILVETVHDGLRRRIVNHLHHAGCAVGVLALGFDLIPAIGGMLEFAVENG